MSVTGFEHLPGTKLAAGTFTITAEEQQNLLRSIEAPENTDAELAHPIWAYFATQRGIAVSVAELCSLADFDVQDGPMLGSVEMEYTQNLRVGVQYTVTGEVVGLTRKVGKKTGTFDILAYRLELLTQDGAAVAACANTFILPRRNLT